MQNCPSQSPCPGSYEDLIKLIIPIIEKADQDGIRVTVSAADLSGAHGYECFSLGSEERYKSASTIKLVIVCALFQMIDLGEILLHHEVTVRSEDAVGGSGSLQQESMPLQTTIEHLARLMITQSDNTATNVLIDVVRFERVKALLHGLKMKGTQLGRKMFAPVQSPDGDNYTDAKELTQLLVYIYEGKLLSKESTRLLLSWMSEQEVTTKFGAVLAGKRIAHKTGEAANVTHDTGYFLIPGKELAIAVMTEVTTTDIYEEAQRIGNPIVQRIGKMIYDQLTNNIEGEE